MRNTFYVQIAEFTVFSGKFIDRISKLMIIFKRIQVRV